MDMTTNEAVNALMWAFPVLLMGVGYLCGRLR